MTHIVLTRPEPDAERQRVLLSARGLQVTTLPLLEIEPVAIAAGAELNLDRCSVIVFTSANAVIHGLRYVSEACNQVSTDVFAIGKKTRELLGEQSIDAKSPDREDSEGLLGLLAKRENVGAQSCTRVALVKGEGGRELLRSALSDEGVSVSEVNCYRRVWPPISRTAVLGALESQEPRYIHVASGETLSRLEELCVRYGLKVHEKHTVILPSDRVEIQARELGWQSRIVSVGASDDALIDVLSTLS